MQYTPTDEMAKTADLARLLGITNKSALQLLRSGKVPGVKLTRSWAIPWSALTAISEGRKP